MEYTKEKAMEWLNKNWHNPKACPICKRNKWAVSDSMAVMSPLLGRGVHVGDLSYPVFLLTCGICGYTMFFNAVVAGFVPENVDSKEIEIAYTPRDKSRERING